MPTPDATVRIATHDLSAVGQAVARVPAELAPVQPDIACVQGAPRFVRWRARSAALARRSGLFYVTGGRPAAGALLLASQRAFVTDHGCVRLPRTAARGAGAAIAVFDIGGRRLAVASVHLTDGRARRHNLGTLLRRLKTVADRHRAPCVLAGTVGDQDHETWRAVVGDEPTDAGGMLVGAGIELTSGTRPEGPDRGIAQQRPPVWVDLRHTDPGR